MHLNEHQYDTVYIPFGGSQLVHAEDCLCYLREAETKETEEAALKHLLEAVGQAAKGYGWLYFEEKVKDAYSRYEAARGNNT